MKEFIRKHHRAVFYITWFLLEIVQAAVTELLDDEAYYWVFSRFLDWGYFDHPPMTPLLIKAGYALFPNELGVRLLIVVMNILTVFLCEKLTEKKDHLVFYAVCLSAAVFQIGGFLAVPDIPLLFFTALFFVCYKRFVQQLSITNTLLLSLVTACMMYSKYHGVLVVFFTLLSNPSLFRRWQTYTAGVLAFLFFLPHLWWQYQHDWISLQYHLFDRNTNPYQVSFTTDYILGQLLIAGPVAGFIFWYALFRHQTKSLTERAMKATGTGILLFFFVNSFRGRIEANWTASAIIPIIVLSHQYLTDHPKAKRWTYRLLPVTLLLVIVLRVVMAVDIVPAKVVAERFHQYKSWPQEMKNRTHNLPVVLGSSYQKASKYWFYSGQTTYSLNQYTMRRNNYNFWPIEDSLLGKPVFVFNSEVRSFHSGDSLSTPLGMIRYSFDSSFHSFSKVMVKPERNDYRVKENESFTIRAKIQAPPFYETYLREHAQTDYPVKAGLFDQQKWIKDVELNTTLQQLFQQQNFSLRINHGLTKGTYFLRIAISSDPGWFTHNSNKIKIEVRGN